MNPWLVPVPLPVVTERTSETMSPVLLSPEGPILEDSAAESIEQSEDSQPVLPDPGLQDPLFAAPPRPAHQG